jgi:hypothetical protein
VLLGSATEDETVTWDENDGKEGIGQRSLEWWVQNNQCDGIEHFDISDVAEAQVCNGGDTECECKAYVGCAAEVVSCTWEGGHEVSEILQPDAVWWLNRHSP